MRSRRAAFYAVPLVVAWACGGGSSPTPPEPSPTPCAPATSAYATRVAEWWIPAGSMAGNSYNDPQQALGASNAGGFGPDSYTGFVSLGNGGHVTVELSGCISDASGNDIRVYQAFSTEPVTVYVATKVEGPYTLLPPFFKDCPSSSRDRLAENRNARGYCDFDLGAAGVSQARYVRVEDAELYPFYAAGTTSEGADLDAVQALGVAVTSAAPGGY